MRHSKGRRSGDAIAPNRKGPLYTLPTDKPHIPGGIPPSNILYRNTTCTLTVSGTDSDNDLLRYIFRVRLQDGNWYFAPVGNTAGKGSNTGSMNFSPSDDARLLVPGYYCVSAQAGDGDGFLSPWSDEKFYYMSPSRAPDTPLLSGPTQGYTADNLNYSVHANDTEGDKVSYRFNWGDGSTTTTRNPTHVYSQAGFHDVTLMASNSHGSTSVTRTACVLALAAPPVADFTQDLTSGPVALTVHFTDRSTGNPTSWLWNFGDGTTSSDTHPSHAYVKPGRYLVSLMVTNSSGCDMKTSSQFIVVNPNTIA